MKCGEVMEDVFMLTWKLCWNVSMIFSSILWCTSECIGLQEKKNEGCGLGSLQQWLIRFWDVGYALHSNIEADERDFAQAGFKWTKWLNKS